MTIATDLPRFTSAERAAASGTTSRDLQIKMRGADFRCICTWSRSVGNSAKSILHSRKYYASDTPGQRHDYARHPSGNTAKAPLKELAVQHGLNQRPSPSGVNAPSSTMRQWAEDRALDPAKGGDGRLLQAHATVSG
jgi:hypothetical protein